MELPGGTMHLTVIHRKAGSRTGHRHVTERFMGAGTAAHEVLTT